MTVFVHEGKESKPIIRDYAMYTDTDNKELKQLCGFLLIRPESPWNVVTIVDTAVISLGLNNIVELMLMFRIPPETIQETLKDKAKVEELERRLAQLHERGVNARDSQFVVTFTSFDGSGRLRRHSIVEDNLINIQTPGRRRRKKKMSNAERKVRVESVIKESFSK